jgi:hypothetical protein
MEFFRRKTDRPPHAGNQAQPASGASVTGGGPTHRVTRELGRAENLARMLAASRAAAAIEPADYLAGMFLYDWERLSRYWQDRQAIEAYLQKICQISPRRWHHWMEFYDRERRKEENWNPAKLFGLQDGHAKNPGSSLEKSSELESILRKAEAIAPHYDTFEGRPIPILTSECVLLAMAKIPGLEIARRLSESGLDVAALEQEARNPRHAPLHGAEEE